MNNETEITNTALNRYLKLISPVARNAAVSILHVLGIIPDVEMGKIKDLCE